MIHSTVQDISTKVKYFFVYVPFPIMQFTVMHYKAVLQYYTTQTTVIKCIVYIHITVNIKYCCLMVTQFSRFIISCDIETTFSSLIEDVIQSSALWDKWSTIVYLFNRFTIIPIFLIRV